MGRFLAFGNSYLTVCPICEPLTKCLQRDVTMTYNRYELIYKRREIGRWTIPTLEFPGSVRSLCVPVIETIANSIWTKERAKPCKVAVASTVKAARGKQAWSPQDQYAISIGFSFHPGNHGNFTDERGRAKLDVENFTKPVVDAIAAGLFCGQETDISSIEHWNYDDSNFNTLLIHRIPDASNPDDEGIAVCVSPSSLGD